MNGDTSFEDDYSEFVEVDPTGRYGRYDEILGKGSSKTVYKAFDEYEGLEVAWNQVKLYDFLQNPEDLERLYREIHLLKTLKHENIMKFCTSWVDTTNRNINFVTEMFTSGTLRQYRLKHKRVNIRAVKHWCTQILNGLLYLHTHDPLVIHRDLKCDNIFINGNQGQVKIGDLGLAAILRKSHAARCVGTPEFMAPEVYEEEYNELVDIYSFGMCILEMVTFEYPYSECTHPAQIYKKVISGKKPEALYKVKDPEVRQFVEKCLATVSCRFSARELLKDHFLQIDDYGFDLRPIDYYKDYEEPGPFLRQPLNGTHHCNTSLFDVYSNYLPYDAGNNLYYDPVEPQMSEIDLFTSQEDEQMTNVDVTIEGKRREDDGIFLRLRIADKEGRIRNIYFPFDIENDTALSVATEMVSELDISDQDVMKIADMIDGEIASLVPEWKRKQEMEEEGLDCTSPSFCQKCGSNGYLMDYASPKNQGVNNLQVLHCSKHGCTVVHGRFEEITYQVEGLEQCVPEVAVPALTQADSIHYADIWAQRDGPESNSPGSRDVHCDNGSEILNQSIEKEEKIIDMDTQSQSNATSSCANPSVDSALFDDYENEIRQELRWLKAKYQMQLRELRDQQLGTISKMGLNLTPSFDNSDPKKDDKASLSSFLPKLKRGTNGAVTRSLSSRENFTSHFPTEADNAKNQIVKNFEASDESFSPEGMVTAKSFYTGSFLPQSLHRATSLPVDSVEMLTAIK
ncbi:probable serine/threonine-protein kinase WNK9 isoform X1 [Carica papaya]|uniref:probable serine/threonine-protein kinase WNK9 isoform X1 n=2 Tax=Carica papaya TaxID=3649 RepID=UPI000B8CCDEB|nr:probable serine/threonine-protein kinase WNK9 isoform X1 [Carica papaya]XP_021897108.1 probable serine/threonine-protein kinase WNK9 isoform X1 [Carica papaya]XP_021897110.1 probable serine/threonine-protein kinase WNK9 isoform X1 [Carica papaya]XP_021897111.1 probable serine/threonine-protein kinase WNK9 isoform X1 [Carica papaya]XP_021897112.1 probable serine/threonine-protein kinase WNK9 isoform X1 [Carica papaya]